MYVEHPNIEKLDDENIKLWRYMDFTRFVSLLEKRALFFTTTKNLPDPFEGYYSPGSLSSNRAYFLSFYKHYTAFREVVLVNCWHMNEEESAAMWELYSGKNAGIAIQTTFRNLASSFRNSPEDVSIGKVNYINYKINQIPLDNSLYPFLHKRKDFVHERELRAIVIYKPDGLPDGRLDLPADLVELGGRYISVALSVLIERIYISPTAPKWFGDLVRSVLGKYDLDKQVVSSTLAEARPVEVYVSGAVTYPESIVPLPMGSCVQDAIDAVGGLTDKADVDGATNLRQVLRGGEHIHVPERPN